MVSKADIFQLMWVKQKWTIPQITIKRWYKIFPNGSWYSTIFSQEKWSIPNIRDHPLSTNGKFHHGHPFCALEIRSTLRSLGSSFTPEGLEGVRGRQRPCCSWPWAQVRKQLAVFFFFRKIKVGVETTAVVKDLQRSSKMFKALCHVFGMTINILIAYLGWSYNRW